MRRLSLKTWQRPKTTPKDGRRDSTWGWWEDLESFGLGKSRFIDLNDGDEVPEEHPEFDPSPQVHTYGRQSWSFNN